MTGLTAIIDAQLAEWALNRVTPARDGFVDLFAEHTVIVVCEVTPAGVRDVQQRVQHGVSLRRVDGVSTRLVHTTDCSERGLATLVHDMEEATRSAVRPPATEGDQEVMLPIADLVEIARMAASEAQRHAGSRFEATATTRAMRQRILVSRSDGNVAEHTRQYASMTVSGIAREGHKVRKTRRSAGAVNLEELTRGDAHLLLARSAADAGLRRLEAVPAPSGAMPVILGPGGPATLLHEACGHALEADIAQYPGSAFHNRVGERVASPLITLIDDPRSPGNAPLYDCDDEGESAEPVVLIDRGILRGCLEDRCTARARETRANGHGRRLNYAYPPLPRMSTTYVAAGESSPAEIIAETRLGIYVEAIGGGDTDMGSGRFNLQVDEGYLVEDGRLGAPIRGAVLSGRGPDVLRAIDRVGNDCAFLSHCYSCNKLDQFPLLVSVGQPTLRVPDLLVWGG